MVSIVIGVTALGAALAGGAGGGYFFWKKTEPNAYDAALFINYKSVYNRAPSPQEQANTIYWKQCSDQFLDDTQATNVVVIGDYKQGKTFVLNRLSGMLLDMNPISTMEGVKFKRTSWLASDKQELNVLLIDTEGLNHLPGDATNRDLITRRKGYDQFLQELSVRFGDVPVLVTDKPSLSFAQRVLDICGLMQQHKQTRTLAVVYNMNNIEKKDDFFQFFEREVVIRNNCSKYENTIPQVTYHHSSEMVNGERFKIVHLPLAKEGTEAAKQFNKNTFEVLRYLVEVEAHRKEEAAERRPRVREQLAALAPLFKHVLHVEWPPAEPAEPSST